MIKWKRNNSISPITYTSDDGRFVIRKTESRWNIRPRPITVTKVSLVDNTTGERENGFRNITAAKQRAEELQAQ